MDPIGSYLAESWPSEWIARAPQQLCLSPRSCDFSVQNGGSHDLSSWSGAWAQSQASVWPSEAPSAPLSPGSWSGAPLSRPVGSVRWLHRWCETDSEESHSRCHSAGSKWPCSGVGHDFSGSSMENLLSPSRALCRSPGQDGRRPIQGARDPRRWSRWIPGSVCSSPSWCLASSSPWTSSEVGGEDQPGLPGQWGSRLLPGWGIARKWLKSQGSRRMPKTCSKWCWLINQSLLHQRRKSWTSYMPFSSPWSISTSATLLRIKALFATFRNWKSGDMKTKAWLSCLPLTPWSGRKSIGWAMIRERSILRFRRPCSRCWTITSSYGTMLARAQSLISSSKPATMSQRLHQRHRSELALKSLGPRLPVRPLSAIAPSALARRPCWPMLRPSWKIPKEKRPSLASPLGMPECQQMLGDQFLDRLLIC